MAKTIPQLTDATTVNAADELIIQQGGITKRATGAELAKGLNEINGIVNIKDFGAVGDGVTDDSAAVQAAGNHAVTKAAATLYFPAGSYLLNSRCTFNLPSEMRLTVTGDGMYSSAILGNNADGALQFTSGVRTAELFVKDLCLSPNLANSGTALEYVVPSGGTQANRIASVTNCAFAPLRYINNFSWNKCIQFNHVYRPILNNVSCWPGSTSTTKLTAIVDLDNCYKPEIESCYFNGAADIGVSHVSTNAEGFLISATTVNGADIGLLKESDGTEPEMTVTNCHFNCRTAGVSILGQKFVWLTDNLMYVGGVDGSTVSSTYCDFLIRGGWGIHISGNIFRQASATERRHVRLDPASGRSVRNVVIRDNGLHAATTVAPFYFGTNASNIELYLPEFVANYDFASYPSKLYEVAGATNLRVITLNSVVDTRDSAAVGPSFALIRDSASPDVNDSIGALYYQGNNSSNALVSYFVAQGNIVDPAAGTGSLSLFCLLSGALTNIMTLGESISFRGTVLADTSRHLGLRSYTVGTLPVATTAARLIYVSNGTSDKRLAVSDGTNWRFPDGAIVS